MAISKSALKKGAKGLDALKEMKKEKEEAPVNEESLSRKEEASFSTAFTSNKGMQEENNNFFAFVEGESYACWVLADGHKGASKAAKLVVEEVLSQFLAEGSFKGKFIKKAMKEANKKLMEKQKEDPSFAEGITSLAVVISDYSSMLIGYIGNTRIYHIANGLINYKTKDHSVAQLMFEADKMGEKDVRYHQRRDDLTKAMGKGKVKPHIEKVPMPLNDGDAILMTTIGAWENLEEREVEVDYSKADSPNSWVVGLEKRILGSGARKLNNYTLVGIVAEEVAEPQGKNKKKVNYKLIAIVVVVILLLAILGFTLGSKAKRKAEIYGKANSYEVQAMANLEDARFKESIEYLRKANTEYQKLITQSSSSNKLVRMVTGQEVMVQSTKKQMEGVREQIGKIDKLVKADVSLDEADKLVQDNKFDEALAIYDEALIVYNNQNFNNDNEIIAKLTEELTDKMDIVKELKMAMGFKAEGDGFYESGDYKQAIGKYSDAKITFVKHGKAELVAELDLKINEINTEAGDLADIARKHESQGYELEYTYPLTAIDHFEKAMDAYRQLKKDNNVDNLNDKILKVKERIVEDIAKADMLYGNALKYASQERFTDALETLDRAKNTYAVNGATDKAKKMDTEIANLKKTMEKKANIQEAFDIEKDALQKHIDKEYTESKKLYLEAMSLFKVNKFDSKVTEIESKIYQVDGNMYEAQGDLAYSDKQLKSSIKAYGDAKKNYEKFGDQELIKRVENKLKGVTFEDNFETALVLEEEGDGLYKEKKYEDSLEKFKESKAYYETLKDYPAIKDEYADIIKGVDKKIKKCEGKLDDTPWLPW